MQIETPFSFSSHSLLMRASASTGANPDQDPTHERLLWALSTSQNEPRPPYSPTHVTPPSVESAPLQSGGATTSKRALKEVRFETPAGVLPPTRANPAPPRQTPRSPLGEDSCHEDQFTPRFCPPRRFENGKARIPRSVQCNKDPGLAHCLRREQQPTA